MLGGQIPFANHDIDNNPDIERTIFFIIPMPKNTPNTRTRSA
jgi:hypothetical protein